MKETQPNSRQPSVVSTSLKDRLPFAVRLLATLIMTVLIVESRHFFQIPYLVDLPDIKEIIVYIFLVTTLIFPILYLFTYQPLLKEITRRTQAESALQEAYNGVGHQVAERTEKLQQTNKMLQDEINQRKYAEKMIETERQRLYSVLNHLPALVYLKAPDFTIRYANDYFIQQFGDPTDHLCHELIHNLSEPCDFCPRFDVLDEHKPVEWDWTFSDGRIYHLYDYPFIDTDGQELMLQLGIDITKRKQAESQLAAQNIALQKLSQAERKQRRLTEGLIQATLALNTSLEMDVVLEKVLDQIQVVIPCSIAVVLLMENEMVKLAGFHSSVEKSESLDKLAVGLPITDLPHIQWAVSERETVSFTGSELQEVHRQYPDMTWIHSMMLTPLDLGTEIIGFIVLASEQDDYYKAIDQDHLKAFSAHAVLAIQNARMYTDIQTAQKQLQALSRHLVNIQEEERRRISRELHDEAGQALTSIKVGLNLIAQHVNDPAAIKSSLENMNHITDEVMINLHRLAVEMRPASLDSLGLVNALEQLTQSQRKSSGFDIQFESLRLTERLSPELEITIYRIVQEALTNVVRHAKADKVDILLQKRAKTIVLTIEDNGIGFEPHKVLTKDCLGLFGMQERVEMLGGKFEIESHTGMGTTIYVEVKHHD